MKNQLLIIATFISMLMGGGFYSISQTIVSTVDEGTQVSPNMPIYGYYTYSYTQSIYYASDMSPDVQGTPSLITKISYFNVSGSIQNSDEWKVYIGTTNKEIFSSNSDWEINGLTEVFHGNITVPGENSWIDIEIPGGYLWDGVSNIVIGVTELSSGYASTSTTVTWGSVATTAKRTILFYSDSFVPDPEDPRVANSTINNVPKIKLEHEINYCEDADFSATNYNFDLTSNIICENEKIHAVFDDFKAYIDVDYQWQIEDNGVWVDIPEANGREFSYLLSEDSEIRVKASCPTTDQEIISESQGITLKEAPTLTTNFEDVAYCPSSSVSLAVSGADTYSWSPSEGLSQTSGNIVEASPTYPIAYIVTGIGVNGCVNSDTIIVSPVDNLINASFSFSDEELCNAPVDILISVENIPSELLDGATFEYLFLDANDEPFTDWIPNNNFLLSALEDSIYSVKFAVRSTDCPMDSTLIDMKNIVVGFGAETEVENMNCHNSGGKISLFNDFGQLSYSTIYENALNDENDVEDIIFEGSSIIADDMAVLTPSQTNRTGSMVVTPDTQISLEQKNITVSFQMTMDQMINNYGTMGADGLAYSFAPDYSTTTSNIHNGRGSKLRLSFDSANNGSNVIGIYLMYGKENTSQPTPSETTTIAYSPIYDIWKGKQDVSVSLSILKGKVTLYVAGQLIFNDVELPSEYLDEDVSDWKHVFSAATGGDAMRHGIRNLNITSGSYEIGISDVPNQEPVNWQFNKEFNDLAPGIYDVWMRKNDSTQCQKFIKTIEILDIDPVVDLGVGYIICEGDSIILDAGNPDAASYLWSGYNNTEQTYTVTEEGTYVVMVTDTSGCVGVGATTVGVNAAPSNVQEDLSIVQNGMTAIFTLSNTAFDDVYNWDLGDGTLINNGPASISHVYSDNGVYEVKVVISNDCGEVTLTDNVNTSTVNVDEFDLGSIRIYPNPTQSDFTIDLGEENSAEVQIRDVSGKLVANLNAISGKSTVSISGWEKGVYFVNVQSKDSISIHKIVVM